ncbi:pyridoxal kinase, variant [Pseudogymnoascus destructans 20631-21]|nr:pyridoxal kinase, variant [Pseudogymnoascus destructans 20631-21]
MAAFVLQALGCEASAINTVNFSNHTGYRQVKGTKATAADIEDLYTGLKNSGLDDFDMMLSGYIPGREAVEVVGTIARELKTKAAEKPGSFFWVLDPVMGDNGKLYVAEDVVSAYKKLVYDADLIMPNQFEAESLSGIRITDVESLKKAITSMHEIYKVPHILITSVNLSAPGEVPSLSVVGSTKTSLDKPRIFRAQVPSLDCFFCGTGDMLAALMVVRLREAVCAVEGLGQKESWVSGDEVSEIELPLARAVERALASMQEVLARSLVKRDEEIAAWEAKHAVSGAGDGVDVEKTRHLMRTKAAEVRLVRNLECLKHPEVKYQAEKIDIVGNLPIGAV